MIKYVLAFFVLLFSHVSLADESTRFPDGKSKDVYGFSQVLYDVYFKFTSKKELHDYIKQFKMKPSDGKLVDYKVASKVLEDLEDPHYRVTGGSVSNTLAGIGRLGGSAYFIGTAMDDEYGHKYEEEMSKYNVETNINYIKDDGITGVVIVLLSPGGERTMLASPGAHQFIDESKIDYDAMSSYKVVFTDGYMWQLPGNEETTKKIFSEARKRKVQTAFSYGDAYIVTKHRAKMLAITKESDVVFSNEAQALALFKTKDIEKAVKEMQKIANIAVITLADEGAYIISKDEVIKLDAEGGEKIVDKTGAGDQFAAGFLYGYTKGLPLEECGKLGIESATRILNHLGGKPL